MIPIAGVSRSSQMLLCREFGKAMEERPSWLGDGVVPLTQVWSMRLLLNRSQQGEGRGRGKGMGIQSGLPFTTLKLAKFGAARGQGF